MDKVIIEDDPKPDPSVSARLGDSPVIRRNMSRIHFYEDYNFIFIIDGEVLKFTYDDLVGIFDFFEPWVDAGMRQLPKATMMPKDVKIFLETHRILNILDGEHHFYLRNTPASTPLSETFLLTCPLDRHREIVQESTESAANLILEPIKSPVNLIREPSKSSPNLIRGLPKSPASLARELTRSLAKLKCSKSGRHSAPSSVECREPSKSPAANKYNYKSRRQSYGYERSDPGKSPGTIKQRKSRRQSSGTEVPDPGQSPGILKPRKSSESEGRERSRTSHSRASQRSPAKVRKSGKQYDSEESEWSGTSHSRKSRKSPGKHKKSGKQSDTEESEWSGTSHSRKSRKSPGKNKKSGKQYDSEGSEWSGTSQSRKSQKSPGKHKIRGKQSDSDGSEMSGSRKSRRYLEKHKKLGKQSSDSEGHDRTWTSPIKSRKSPGKSKSRKNSSETESHGPGGSPGMWLIKSPGYQQSSPAKSYQDYYPRKSPSLSAGKSKNFHYPEIPDLTKPSFPIEDDDPEDSSESSSEPEFLEPKSLPKSPKPLPFPLIKRPRVTAHMERLRQKVANVRTHNILMNYYKERWTPRSNIFVGQPTNFPSHGGLSRQAPDLMLM